ncbi:MAG: FHA domain-containing protein [Burkholderiales bacterium]|nr:FHA domain-containing protein [Burkholderiales bacterium]
MLYTCPRAHQSTDADYCSECGARIQAQALNASPAAPSVSPAAAPKATNGDLCPDCATARPAGARFCEVCRYDFANRASFAGLNATPPAKPLAPPTLSTDMPPPLPAVEVIFDPAPAGAAAIPTSTPIAAPARLQLRIMVDPSLDTDPDPASPCPVGQVDRIFHIDLDENTLGRQYEGRGVHPEIVVNDPGISRRHVKFLRGADGRVTVLELGSANGTGFNGQVLEPGVVTPVQPGDEITLGMWTRIRIEAR